MIKHIGKHGDRKVAIVFREVPGEEHMCLVIYPEVLPVSMHDSIMRVIESDMGQAADSLGDVLFRSMNTNGQPILQTLHAEGMLKKVQTRQITVTPNANSHVNLEEMNSIIREMKTGEAAIKRLADLDNNSGMTGRVKQRDDFGREIGAPTDQVRAGSAGVAGSDAARALDDQALAQDFQRQAQRMAAEARSLLAESERLMREAQQLQGEPAPVAAPRTRTRRRKSEIAAANAA